MEKKLGVQTFWTAPKGQRVSQASGGEKIWLKPVDVQQVRALAKATLKKEILTYDTSARTQ